MTKTYHPSPAGAILPQAPGALAPATPRRRVARAPSPRGRTRPHPASPPRTRGAGRASPASRLGYQTGLATTSARHAKNGGMTASASRSPLASRYVAQNASHTGPSPRRHAPGIHHRAEHVVDGQRREIVRRIAPPAAARVEQGEVRALAEEDVVRVEVAVRAPQPVRAAPQLPAEGDRALLDAGEPLRRRRARPRGSCPRCPKMPSPLPTRSRSARRYSSAASPPASPGGSRCSSTR